MVDEVVGVGGDHGAGCSLLEKTNGQESGHSLQDEGPECSDGGNRNDGDAGRDLRGFPKWLSSPVSFALAGFYFAFMLLLTYAAWAAGTKAEFGFAMFAVGLAVGKVLADWFSP